MTNTANSIYTSITGGVVDTVDGLIGIAVTILAVTVVLALVSKWVPKKRKVA